MSNPSDFGRHLTTDSEGNRILYGLTVAETADVDAWLEGSRNTLSLDEDDRFQKRCLALWDKHLAARSDVFRQISELPTIAPKARPIPENDPRMMLSTALNNLATHVRQSLDITAWDTFDPPTKEQERTRAYDILDQQRYLKQLSIACWMREVLLEEFEAIRDRLRHHRFVAFKPQDLAAVYNAFYMRDQGSSSV